MIVKVNLFLLTIFIQAALAPQFSRVQFVFGLQDLSASENI